MLNIVDKLKIRDWVRFKESNSFWKLIAEAQSNSISTLSKQYMVGTGEDVNAAGSSPPPALATTFLYELNICKRLSTWKVLNLGPIKCFILLKQHWTLIHFMFPRPTSRTLSVLVATYCIFTRWTLHREWQIGNLYLLLFVTWWWHNY